MDFQNFLIHNTNIPLIPEYITNMKELNQIGDNCMIKGVDKKYRPMVCIIFVMKNEMIKDIFYKRYRLFFENWYSVGNRLLDTSTGITKNQFTLLKEVLCNKLVQIQEYHYPIKSEYIGEYVCNRRVWDAVKIIQKTWRKYKFLSS